MASDRKSQSSKSIPIRFDGDERDQIQDAESDSDATLTEEMDQDENGRATKAESATAVFDRGPELAELIASRAEIKRLQNGLTEAQEALARRQADFENYRKRTERERGETYNRVVAQIAAKLLPVVDNLARALEAERSIETDESKEFRHFLHGVELINKQLSDVLQSFGIEPIAAVGQPFDPHIHEAVVTEPSDEYEADTVTEELARGYRIGNQLLRPAMVKVAAQKSER